MYHKKSRLTIALAVLSTLSFQLSTLSAATPTPTPTPTATPSPTPANVGQSFSVDVVDNLNAPGSVGYHIKYGATSGGPYTTTVDIPKPGTFHDFTAFPIGTIYAVVTAYTPIAESPASPETQINVFPTPFTPGMQIINKTAMNDTGLEQISTRGQVAPGDNVMIGGFIMGAHEKVALRAIGPSLGALGVPDPLSKATIELHDSTGVTIKSNDGWKTGPDVDELIALDLAPTNDKESALIATLDPGAYTAIVRGSATETGVGLVEVYQLP